MEELEAWRGLQKLLHSLQRVAWTSGERASLGEVLTFIETQLYKERGGNYD